MVRARRVVLGVVVVFTGSCLRDNPAFGIDGTGTGTGGGTSAGDGADAGSAATSAADDGGVSGTGDGTSMGADDTGGTAGGSTGPGGTTSGGSADGPTSGPGTTGGDTTTSGGGDTMSGGGDTTSGGGSTTGGSGVTPTRITINNSLSEPLTKYQVLATVDTASIVSAGDMNADGSDIRLRSGADCSAAVPHWIESGMNTAQTRIWMVPAALPASGMRTVYLESSGDAGQTSVADGNGVFEIFDDFSGNILDAGKWSQVGSFATLEVSGGELTMAGEASVSQWDWIYTSTPVVDQIVAHIRYHGGNAGCGLLLSGAGGSAWYSIGGDGGNPDQMRVVRDPNNVFTTTYPDLTNPRTVHETLHFAARRVGPDIIMEEACNETLGQCDNEQTVLDFYPASSLSVGIASQAPQWEITVDHIFVRKYRNPEPSVVVGPVAPCTPD